MSDATFHVVCSTCRFECVTDDHEEARERWLSHRQASEDSHDVTYDAIDGTVECEQCGEETPVDGVKHLINVLTEDRSFICEPCYAAGAIW